MSKPWGYVIRTPSERLEGEPRYYFSQDPFELKDKYYEGFNPVLECYIWKEPKKKPSKCEYACTIKERISGHLVDCPMPHVKDI